MELTPILGNAVALDKNKTASMTPLSLALFLTAFYRLGHATLSLSLLVGFVVLILGLGGGQILAENVESEEAGPDPFVAREDPVKTKLAFCHGVFLQRYQTDVQKPHQEAVSQLNIRFLGAVKSAEDKAAEKAELQTMLLLQGDAKRIAAGEGLPVTDQADTPAAVTRLRDIYRSELKKLETKRDASAKPILEGYIAALRDYEVELAKARDIEGGLKVQAARKQVAADGVRVFNDSPEEEERVEDLAGQSEHKAAEPSPQPPQSAVDSPDDSNAAATPNRSAEDNAKTFTNGIGQKMIWVPAGSFRMGDLTGKGDDDEKPVRTVELSGYHLGSTEVTQGQWQAVMGSNPSRFKGTYLPVERVSWTAAMDFCKTLTEQEKAAGRLPEGFEYTLPTEAQWEYACRAGTEGDFAGDLNAMAWFKENSGGKTHPVGKKNSNAWGFYDMHGNVWEWCLDRHGIYEGLETKDPTGNATGSNRVVRGGSWLDYASFCRSANRDWVSPVRRNTANQGFRVALSSRREP